jgi:hypothetical protein
MRSAQGQRPGGGCALRSTKRRATVARRGRTARRLRPFRQCPPGAPNWTVLEKLSAGRGGMCSVSSVVTRNFVDRDTGSCRRMTDSVAFRETRSPEDEGAGWAVDVITEHSGDQATHSPPWLRLLSDDSTILRSRYPSSSRRSASQAGCTPLADARSPSGGRGAVQAVLRESPAALFVAWLSATG